MNPNVLCPNHLGDQVKLNEQDYQKLVDVYDGEKIVVSSYGLKKDHLRSSHENTLSNSFI